MANHWHAVPRVWGQGPSLLGVFLEPTCPFSVKTFNKLDTFLAQAGENNARVQIWLHSQPWHLYSSVVIRAIIAASTLDDILKRLEDYSGLALIPAFKISDLDSVTKQHAKYARQNGIHGSPTFMIDGLIDPTMSSGDDVSEWVKRFS